MHIVVVKDLSYVRFYIRQKKVFNGLEISHVVKACTFISGGNSWVVIDDESATKWRLDWWYKIHDKMAKSKWRQLRTLIRLCLDRAIGMSVLVIQSWSPWGSHLSLWWNAFWQGLDEIMTYLENQEMQYCVISEPCAWFLLLMWVCLCAHWNVSFICKSGCKQRCFGGKHYEALIGRREREVVHLIREMIPFKGDTGAIWPCIICGSYKKGERTSGD